ncbi:hypothetical protein BJ508DRAFT_314493 [Ascobolus immersus RN42]|uniref:Uncharacterized protein n=1 Tax=Ascobolus immersus RN42 TaxID=1160509 RepID=A0A3N4HJD1_ASCIM|nr:hypothetical protein BJ508DRAFT_314493 [Ascobolus immersus RN42]
MYLQRDFRDYPPTPSQYPDYDLHRLYYLTPTFRLRTATGPVTLDDLLNPKADKHFYLEILWEHPPSSWWERRKLKHVQRRELGWGYGQPEIDGRVASYYVSVAKRLFGGPSKSRTDTDCQCRCKMANPDWPLGPCINAGKYFDHKSMYCNRDLKDSESCTMGDKAGYSQACMFDVLKAIEVDRLIREEIMEQQAKADAVGESRNDIRYSENAKRWWMWQFREYQAGRRKRKWERCYAFEMKMARYLGIRPPPASFKELDGWRGDLVWEFEKPKSLICKESAGEAGLNELLHLGYFMLFGCAHVCIIVPQFWGPKYYRCAFFTMPFLIFAKALSQCSYNLAAD